MYYDLLIRIKNAEIAEKDSLTATFSKLNHAVAKILAETGYIKDVQKKSVGKKNFLEIKLSQTKQQDFLNLKEYKQQL